MPLPDSTLEKLPTEILVKIVESLDFVDVSIAFTCPRMYEIFKDVHPKPISLFNTGIYHDLDDYQPTNSEEVHLLLLEYSPILRVYDPKDYAYKLVCLCHSQEGFYARFLRRPYYDDPKNFQDLRRSYGEYELFSTDCAGVMPKDFLFPYPYNKGHNVYELEKQQAFDEIIDALADMDIDYDLSLIGPMMNYLREAKVNELVTMSQSLNRFGE